MKRLFFVIMITALLVSGSIFASFLGCAKTKSRSLPTRESVEVVMTTFAQLEHTLGLCIIAGAPAHVPRNIPPSFDAKEIQELNKEIARSKKIIAFLEGIESVDTGEVVKAKAKTYLRAPSQKTAEELMAVLNLYIRQVKSELRAPLWQELVPASLTAQALKQVRQLEQQAGQM